MKNTDNYIQDLMSYSTNKMLAGDTTVRDSEEFMIRVIPQLAVPSKPYKIHTIITPYNTKHFMPSATTNRENWIVTKMKLSKREIDTHSNI